MSLANKFADLLERAQKSEEYWRDIAVTDFTRELHERMRSLDMTHAELARLVRSWEDDLHWNETGLVTDCVLTGMPPT